MGDIKFYSPVDFDDTSSGVTIEGDLIANANVGIGTTSPSQALHINKENPYIRIQDSSALTRSAMTAGITMNDSTGAQSFQITHSNSADVLIRANAGDLSLGTFAGEILRIDGSNVGIGTTSPSSILHINTGTGTNDANTVFIDRPASSDYSALSFATAGTVDWSVGQNSANNFEIYEDGLDAKTRLTVAVGGNVGIGTASPSEKLGVISGDNIGTTKIISAYSLSQSQSTSLGYNSIMGSYSLNVATLTTQPITFSPNSSEKMRITSTGNVGIGTTSPSQLLHLSDSQGHTQRIQFGLDSIYNYIGVTAYDVFELSVDENNANGNSSMAFRLDGSEKMRISTSGNVGIGTTSPGQKLHIEASDPRIKIVDTDGTNWESEVFTQGGALKLQARNGTNFGNISFQGDNGTTQSEYARFNSSGNFGIGTTSPGSKLHVFNAGYPQMALQSNGGTWQIGVGTGNDLAFRRGTSGSNYPLWLDSSDNVGIGTTSPQQKLDTPNIIISGPSIAASYRANATLMDNLGGVARFYSLGADTSTGGSYQFNSLSSNATAGSGTLMSILNNGNVGIGTTTPTTKLHVTGITQIVESGNAAFYGGNYVRMFNDQNYNFRNSGGTTIANIAMSGNTYFNGGNVGIGTTSPNHKLTINASNNTTALGIDFPSAHFDFSANSTSGYTTSFHMDDTATTIGSNSAGRALIFQTNNTDRLYINGNTGNVGIGTTSPGYKLEISEDTDTTVNLLRLRNADSLYSQTWDFQLDTGKHLVVTGGSSAGGIVLKPGSAGLNVTSTAAAQIFLNSATGHDSVLNFHENSSQKGKIGYDTSLSGIALVTGGGAFSSADMVVLDSGNVGIGTTSPGSKLEVNGDITIADGNRLNIKSAGGTYTGYIEKDTYNATVNLGLTTTFTGARRIYINDGTNQRWEFGGTTTGASDNIIAPGNGYSESSIYAGHLGNIGFFTRASTVAANVMQLFDRTDNNNHGVKLIYQSGGTYSDGLVLDNTGNVGIGTTSPGYSIDVNNTTNEAIARFYRSDSATSISHLVSTGRPQTRYAYSGYQTWFLGNNLGTFGIGTGYLASTTPIFNITSSGNVGIGTTSPSQKLHVDGNARITGAIYDSNNSPGTSGQVLSSTATGTDWVSLSEIQGVDGTGTANYVTKWSDSDTVTDSVIFDNGTNVGIGTTSPSAKLDVAGNTDTNVFLGRAKIGSYVTDYMYLSHYDYGTSSNYALKQAPTGSTNVNAPTGQSVGLGINNSTKLLVNSAGNVGIGTTSPDSLVEIDSTPASQSQTRMLHLDNNPGSNQGSGYLEISSGTNSQAKTQIEQVSSGGFGLLGNQYIDTNIINRGLSSSAHGNINFATGSSSSSTSIVMTIGGGSQKGNVGIGTTSPDVKLHVSGNAKATNIYVADSIIHTGDTNNYFKFDTDTQIFATSGAERMRINSSGNVGIGTTGPAQKLHINGNFLLENNNEIRQKDSGGTQRTIIELDSSNDLNIGGSYSGALKFIGGGSYTEQMRIHDDGNVGIGTTSPSEKLSVDGNVEITTGGNTYLNVNHGNVGFIKFTDTSIASPNQFLIQHNYAQNNDFRIARTTGGSDLVINSSGNVGIGTASPTAPLSISNSSSETLEFNSSISSQSRILSYNRSNNSYRDLVLDGLDIIFKRQSSETVRITSSGNVGIGTASPATKLHISDATTPEFRIEDTTNNRYLSLYQNDSNSYIQTSLNSPLVFSTHGSNERMRITTSGNVGIGTTSPAAPLDVNGNIQITGGANTLIFDNSTIKWQQYVNTNEFTLRYYNGSNWNERLRVDTDGNVGIGTTNPEAKLHVTDSIRIDTGSAGPSAAPTTGTPTQAQVKSGGSADYYLSEPDTWLTVNIDGTDYVIPAYEA